jgi:hypothetical protein
LFCIQALANAFIPLHDAHTRYNKPKPYAATYFVQPIRYDSIVRGGRQSIHLRYSATDMDMYETLYGESIFPEKLGSLDGWEIVSMDGMNPIEAITEAIDVSTSKDAGSRFNLAVNG